MEEKKNKWGLGDRSEEWAHVGANEQRKGWRWRPLCTIS